MPIPILPPRIRPPEPRTPLPQNRVDYSALAAMLRRVISKYDVEIEDIRRAIADIEPDLSAYVTGAEYVSAEKKIYLKHGDTRLPNPVDATAFVKDGMVNDVRIVNVPGDETPEGVADGDYLKVAFNTDAGLETIYLPLAGIFNPANYYDKTAVDQKLLGKQASLTPAQLANIAAVSSGSAFDETVGYEAGTPVVYDGDIYVFTARHQAGPWTGTDATKVNVLALIQALQNGKLSISGGTMTGSLTVPSGYHTNKVFTVSDGGLDYLRITRGSVAGDYWYIEHSLKLGGQQYTGSLRLPFDNIIPIGANTIAGYFSYNTPYEEDDHCIGYDERLYRCILGYAGGMTQPKDDPTHWTSGVEVTVEYILRKLRAGQALSAESVADSRWVFSPASYNGTPVRMGISVNGGVYSLVPTVGGQPAGLPKPYTDDAGTVTWRGTSGAGSPEWAGAADLVATRIPRYTVGAVLDKPLQSALSQEMLDNIAAVPDKASRAEVLNLVADALRLALDKIKLVQNGGGVDVVAVPEADIETAVQDFIGNHSN